MKTPPLDRRTIGVAAGALAALVLLVAVLASLSRSDPSIAPAAVVPPSSAPATSTSTTTTTVPAEAAPETTTEAPPAPVEAEPTGLSPLPARTSRVATVVGSGDVTVYDGPSGGATSRTIGATGDYGQQQVFLVLDDPAEGDRLHVLLPVRPNGSRGWIDADTVSVTTHDYQIQVSLSGFQMMVQKGSDVVVDTAVGVGRSDTPTVGGEYYTWVLINPTNAGYGSFAYGLSGFSTLESFNGGDGRMGIHGDTDPSSFGREVSHGCVRVPDDTMVELVEQVGLPLGVPVVVSA